jgi:hypothetical protein
MPAIARASRSAARNGEGLTIVPLGRGSTACRIQKIASQPMRFCSWLGEAYAMLGQSVEGLTCLAERRRSSRPPRSGSTRLSCFCR